MRGHYDTLFKKQLTNDGFKTTWLHGNTYSGGLKWFTKLDLANMKYLATDKDGNILKSFDIPLV